MLVGACGFGGTGSSAVKDILKEFSNIQVLDRAESMYAFKVDGLQDLEYHLVKQFSRNISGDNIIKRFLYASRYSYTLFVKKTYLDSARYRKDTEEFINSLIQIRYRGMENVDYETGCLFKNFVYLAFKKFVIKYYEKLTNKVYTAWPMRDLYVSIKPEDFYEKCKIYTKNIIENAGGDFSKIIVLDQPFEGNNPTQSFPFFYDPYAIVIDRDPRDLYMIASYLWKAEPFMPRRDPIAFVEYYRRQRMNIDFSKDTERVLRLGLEELIFDYDNSISKIIKFLGLDYNTHLYKQKYFKPHISMRGTQLYKKIPGHDSEIAFIEKNLGEYIFNFENYELSKNNTVLTKSCNWYSEEDKI